MSRVGMGVVQEWTYDSDSVPGQQYTVRLRGDGTWTCECLGMMHHGHCKHVKRAQADCAAFEQGLREERARLEKVLRILQHYNEVEVQFRLSEIRFLLGD